MNFEFGKNWKRFLKDLDERRIQQAENSLKEMLAVSTLEDKRILDAGCGSGLFSLAARLLNGDVTSFDVDAQSIECADYLKQKYFNSDAKWTILAGSVLDPSFMNSLGSFDVVYSWGVLHHTGSMWESLKNVSQRVKPNGLLFIALYNDQGFSSSLWRFIKRLYNQSPRLIKKLILGVCFIRIWGPTFIKDLLKGNPLKTWNNYYQTRGMSAWVDVVDWVGGYPFEVATPEAIISFLKNENFALSRLKDVGRGYGCNEFVFQKSK